MPDEARRIAAEQRASSAYVRHLGGLRYRRGGGGGARGDRPERQHQRSIPEETVDLFELYIALVVTSLGLQPKFVDSWYYHLNHGEIHCGTNALRKPLATGTPKWWTL